MSNKIQKRKNDAKTILFASLIAAMILPFSSMGNSFAQQTPGEEDGVNGNGPVGIVNEQYVELLKQQETYVEMNDAEKELYESAILNSMYTASPYQKEVYKLLDKLSGTILDIQKAESNDQNITELLEEQHAIIFDLEMYGVTTQDRLEQNMAYWANKAQEAKEKIENDEPIKASFKKYLGSSTIHQIHTADVSIKNEAQINFPCLPYNLNIIRCWVMDTKWGGGSYASVSQFIPISGIADMIGKIFLSNSGGHETVTAIHTTQHKVISLADRVVFSRTHGPTEYELIGNLPWPFVAYEEELENRSVFTGSTVIATSQLGTTVTVSN